MKKLGLALVASVAMFSGAGMCPAQTATPAPATPVTATVADPGVANLYLAGVSFNGGGTPAVAGTALYAHQVNNSGTYAFTLIDALPSSAKPFTVNTNIGAGVAQKVATVAGADIFVPSALGISFNGSNTGWAWSTGAGAVFKIKRSGASTPWLIMPTVRVLKSSVTGGTGYQPVVGVLFGWGK